MNQSWTITFLCQYLFSQQVYDFKLSPIVESVGLVLSHCKHHHFCLSTQDFLLAILAVLVFQGRNIDLNLCVKSCFGDFFVCMSKLHLCDHMLFLLSESCWLTLSWKLSFRSFWFLLPRSFCYFWLLRASWNTFFLLILRLFCVVNLQSVLLPILRS